MRRLSCYNTEFREEQIKNIKRIDNCRDDYEILDITEGATNLEIKCAYENLAMLLHPGENNARGTAKAFKSVQNASINLSNKQKFRNEESKERGRSFIYDLCQLLAHNAVAWEKREIEPIFSNTRYRQQQILNMRRINDYFMYYYKTFELIKQMARFLLLFGVVYYVLSVSVVYFVLSWFQPRPTRIYSLVPTLEFEIQRRTSYWGFPYYVGEHFFYRYKKYIPTIDNYVDNYHFENMNQKCQESSYRSCFKMWALFYLQFFFLQFLPASFCVEMATFIQKCILFTKFITDESKRRAYDLLNISQLEEDRLTPRVYVKNIFQIFILVLAFVLILVLLAIGIKTSFHILETSVYSLAETSRFKLQRTTSQWGFPYYVKENFVDKHQGSIQTLEDSVEDAFFASMIQNCRERSYRDCFKLCVVFPKFSTSFNSTSLSNTDVINCTVEKK